jgi:putative hydrolase of the HAD superfamily
LIGFERTLSHCIKKKRKRGLPGLITHSIKAVLFDFGGVLSEEGFREGLMAIGRTARFSPEAFFETAAAAVYDSGYVLGKADESAYWAVVRERTGINGSDKEFRSEILERFQLRPWMLEIVRGLRDRGYIVGILSDQSQWLDELDERHDFFKEFHEIFNSYHLGKGKKDPSLFPEIAAKLGVKGLEILFIDDNEGNVERARTHGWNTILYRNREDFLEKIKDYGLSLS